MVTSGLFNNYKSFTAPPSSASNFTSRNADIRVRRYYKTRAFLEAGRGAGGLARIQWGYNFNLLRTR